MTGEPWLSVRLVVMSSCIYAHDMRQVQQFRYRKPNPPPRCFVLHGTGRWL
jgi:hypothetical protein